MPLYARIYNMKTLFIYNPYAGKTQIKNYLYDILNVFASAKYDLTVVPTTKPKEALKYVREHVNDYELIVCSGGDGTLNEVINGYLKSSGSDKPVLGYIPAGSTNDYARSIGLPKNMVNAANVIVDGSSKSYDMGKFNNDYFVYVAAFGAFTSVSYATPQDTKNVLGHAAYVIEGMRSLSDIKAYKMHVSSKELDIEDKFIYGMVTNTYSVGGMYKLDKRTTHLDDGLLEVMLVKQPKDIIDLNDIASFLLGTSKESDLVYTFKTSKISFESKANIDWTLDGEFGGNTNKVTIRNINKAINIITK